MVPGFREGRPTTACRASSSPIRIGPPRPGVLQGLDADRRANCLILNETWGTNLRAEYHLVFPRVEPAIPAYQAFLFRIVTSHILVYDLVKLTSLKESQP